MWAQDRDVWGGCAPSEVLETFRKWSAIWSHLVHDFVHYSKHGTGCVWGGMSLPQNFAFFNEALAHLKLLGVRFFYIIRPIIWNNVSVRDVPLKRFDFFLKMKLYEAIKLCKFVRISFWISFFPNCWISALFFLQIRTSDQLRLHLIFWSLCLVFSYHFVTYFSDLFFHLGGSIEPFEPPLATDLSMPIFPSLRWGGGLGPPAPRKSAIGMLFKIFFK